MFAPDLIRKINSGRCFALVGAGPSLEIGYPSWEILTNKVVSHVLKINRQADKDSYDKFITNGDFPAALRQAEVDLGSRESLVSIVRPMLEPRRSDIVHPIYEYIAKWPFACYITTNYDNELYKYLYRAGHHFTIIQNRQTDLSLLRNGVSHLIVKIHSDLDNLQDTIITSLDYSRILISPEGAHIREKLRQVFEMFDILIIGHSMSDPDLRLILETAKQTANPLHPLYMFLANSTSGDVREFLERYNIQLIAYKDDDNSHRNLRKMIEVADHFICPRGLFLSAIQQPNEDEVRAASSLYIYRRLQTVLSSETIHGLLEPLVLSAVVISSKPLSLSEIQTERSLASLARTPNLAPHITDCLNKLVRTGMVDEKAGLFCPTPAGQKTIETVLSQRKLEEDQAFGQFSLDFKKLLPSISDQDLHNAKNALRDSLISTFQARGLAMASVIIANQSVGIADLPDLFREFSTQAARFSDLDTRAAFIEAAHAFLVEPNSPQRRYLASISQGFFLYHLAGFDPTCAKIRKNIFADTCWFIDSSIIIPLLAVGCHNHEYALDLFAKIKDSNGKMFTTKKLLEEAWRHLNWATDFVKAKAVDSPDFLAAALAKEGYKQNLFIDGYIGLAAEGVVSSLGEYLDKAFPHGITQDLFIEECKAHGIYPISLQALKGFDQKDWGDIETIKMEVINERAKRGTLRSDLQVEAEAEVLFIIRKIRKQEYLLADGINPSCRVYFVSQSRILDMINEGAAVVTWSPEAIYRYVASLNGQDLDPDLLQKCMLNEYYYAGISFIDRQCYLRFFGPSVNQAKIAYKDQLDKYLIETEQVHRRKEYDEEFDHIPDLEKPFFVAQMGWQVARAAEQRAREAEKREEDARLKAQQQLAGAEDSASRRITEAEERARVAKVQARTAKQAEAAERKQRIRAEQEANRRRNLRDPRHLRKRERQAKKRARKKRG